MDFQPNPDAMQAFLDHLFGDAMTGRIELAWTDAGDGKLRHAQLFPADALDELVTEDMGAVRFAEELGRVMRNRYAGYDFDIYGDPAGDERARTDENTPFNILQARVSRFRKRRATTRSSGARRLPRP